MNFIFMLLCLLVALSEADPVVDFDATENVIADGVSGTGSGRKRDLRKIITEEVLEDVFKNCQRTLKERHILESKLHEKGRAIKATDRKIDPSLSEMWKSHPIIHYREARQLPFDEASNQLYKRYNLTRDEIEQTLPTLPLSGVLSQNSRLTCRRAIETPHCDRNSKFRTANGHCNNFQNPTWGSAASCQKRMMLPYYVGNSDFRESVLGGPLPSPRTLSLNLHYHMNRTTNDVTHMYMFFGQLLDHDIAFTPVSRTVDNERIQCCPPQQGAHEQCKPILIEEDDPFYSQFGITCLNFVRAAICSTCTLGSRQQINQLTAFIDASFVYGNSDNETASLRANDGTGLMRIQRTRHGDLMPASPNPTEDQCSVPETNDICFQAGDFRVNQNPILTSLHTLFLREHNRLAFGLRQMNSHWGEERLFQEARRIVGAEMQVITYKEFLPITLGNDRMSYYKLQVGNMTNYDAEEDPSLTIEFSTAAYRFGHSLINSVIANSPPNATNGLRLLRNEFFQPFDLYKGYVGPLVRGASNSPAQRFDQHLVPDVTNFLYRIRGEKTGLDLASLNINRGRDHGIPTYVDMVRFCSEYKIVIRSFNDLYRLNLMKNEQAEALRRNYRDVKDVDLWPGILMETPKENAIVGPTATCIIGLQFQKLKFGDRFYFENNNVDVKFRYQQIEELRKVSLSMIICLNTDVSQIAQNAMLFLNESNPMSICTQERGVDLSYWRE